MGLARAVAGPPVQGGSGPRLAPGLCLTGHPELAERVAPGSHRPGRGAVRVLSQGGPGSWPLAGCRETNQWSPGSSCLGCGSNSKSHSAVAMVLLMQPTGPPCGQVPSTCFAGKGWNPWKGGEFTAENPGEVQGGLPGRGSRGPRRNRGGRGNDGNEVPVGCL